MSALNRKKAFYVILYVRFAPVPVLRRFYSWNEVENETVVVCFETDFVKVIIDRVPVRTS